MKKDIEVTTEAEVEGPFNFKMLLRKTNRLPTDTLRRRRNGNGESFKETEFMKVFVETKKENVEPFISLEEEEIVL